MPVYIRFENKMYLFFFTTNLILPQTTGAQYNTGDALKQNCICLFLLRSTLFTME